MSGALLAIALMGMTHMQWADLSAAADRETERLELHAIFRECAIRQMHTNPEWAAAQIDKGNDFAAELFAEVSAGVPVDQYGQAFAAAIIYVNARMDQAGAMLTAHESDAYWDGFCLALANG